MPTGFINSDKDFSKLSAEELLAAEEKLRKNRKAVMLRRAVKTAPQIAAKTGFKGSTGNIISRIVQDYAARVRAAGGTVESLECVRATLEKLYYS